MRANIAKLYFLKFLCRAGISAMLLMVLLCSTAFTAFATSAPEGSGETADTQITEGVSVILSDGQSATTVTDEYTGSYIFLADAEIEITSESAFSYIYIIWDTPPEPWQLTAGGSGGGIHGVNGFLHELVVLSSPVNEATIILSEAEHRLCDIYLFGEGELPDWVQQWQPILPQADMLVLSTHGDDEFLFYGGTLPTYAGERELDVQVVYLTNHWGERYRPHEQLNGLWTAGVTAYPLMGPFPDLYASKEGLEAAMATYGYDEVLEFQVGLLRRFKPQVVVGHDLNGEYGHGAHMLNSETLIDALPLASDPAAYTDSAETYGVWDVPKTYLHLYPENEIEMNWSIPLENFGGATSYDIAVDAFAQHVSQTIYYEVTLTPTYHWQNCQLFGLYRSLVGPDVAQDDMFENIDLNPPAAESSAQSEISTSSLPASSVQSAAVSSQAPPQQQEDTPIVLAFVVTLAVLALLVVAILFGTRQRGRRRR